MRKVVNIGFLAAVIGLGLLWVGSLNADEGGKYTEAPVSNGGTLTGKITFKGTPPPPKEFDLNKFPQPKYCGQVDNDGKGHRLFHEVNVSNGMLADVVVYIDDVKSGKPFKFKGTDVKANLCRFLVQDGPSELVGVVENKNEIRVLNTDADPSDPKSASGVLHNPHGYEVKGHSSSTLFNKPLPNKGQTLDEKLHFHKHGSSMLMQCDQHNFMNAYFLPVENPYYAIVGKDGTFSIDGIPPGDYEVEAWHPILGDQEQKITVAANGKVTANFEFTEKK
jgi:hypothetical protein